jgi:hypothetical protein
MRMIFGVLLLTVLAGCAQHTWVPGPGADTADFDVAKARCSLMARHDGSSFSASGSPSFVAGSSVGYALGEAVRTQQDFNDCLLASGWKIADRTSQAGPVQSPQSTNSHTTSTGSASMPAQPPRISDSAQVSLEIAAAKQFCIDLDKDARLDPLRGVVALDAPPTLEMQSNAGYLTEEQKGALNAYQPFYNQCRDRLISIAPEIAQLLEGTGNRNADLLNLYQRKMTIGAFNRVRADDFDRVKVVLSKLAPTPAPALPTPASDAVRTATAARPAPAAPTPATAARPAPSASQPATPSDNCQGGYIYGCQTNYMRYK